MEAEMMSKKIEGKQAQNNFLDDLAKMDDLEFDRSRKSAAKLLGISLKTVDKEVAKRRKAPEPEQVNAIEDLVAWDEPVDGKVLADTIHGEISAHVIMSKECATAITLWIMLSYTYEAFIILPLLSILSPQRRCGKTHLMTMLRAFCYRGLMSSNISNAGIFRIAHAKKPTLLLDELDTYYKDNEHLRGILNSGHNYYSAIHVRVNTETGNTEEFNTFVPKALALIGTPPDTVKDRSIIINLGRKKADEPVEKISKTIIPDSTTIRRKLKRWADDNMDMLRGSTIEAPNLGNDRMQDNWTPLFAIAEIIGWVNDADNAMRFLSKYHDDDDSIGIMLLEDIEAIMQENNFEKISSADLVTKLADLEHRPWPEWRNAKPISKTALARQLGKFNVKPKTIRIGSGTMKGYEKSQFGELFIRYLPKYHSQNATPSQTNNINKLSGKKSVTQQNDVTFQSVTQESHVTDKKDSNPLELKESYTVTDENINSGGCKNHSTNDEVEI